MFANADQDGAGRTSRLSSCANQGQVCLGGSRIDVERSVYQPFLENLVAGAKALKIGVPLDESTEQGALASRAQFDKISYYVDLARELGGTSHGGGQEPGRVSERCADGYFFEPTVMTDLPADCRVNQEEIFGPVVTVTPFDTEDEAVAYANGTAYGLAASVWTRDLARAHRVAERVDAGTVWIHCWMGRDLRAPFGGMKPSGVGRAGGGEALRCVADASSGQGGHHGRGQRVGPRHAAPRWGEGSGRSMRSSTGSGRTGTGRRSPRGCCFTGTPSRTGR